MRKSITPVIAIVLLISMTVFAAAMSFFWINSVQSSIEERVGSNIENAPGTDCTRLNLISVRGDRAVVKNVGCDNVTEFNMLINGRLTKYTLDEPLAPGESTIVTYSPQTAGEDLTVEIVGSWGTTSLTSPADENTEEAGFTSNNSSSGSQPTNPLHTTSASIIEFDGGLKGYCNAYSDDENDILRYNFSWKRGNITLFSNIGFKYGNIGSGNDYFSSAILTNGSALSWGTNSYGQLGDGTTTNRYVPIYVSGNYNFSQRSDGGDHSCGILANGSAVCWGSNSNGQLGDGTTTDRYIPTFVSGNYNWSQISAGDYHSCGILTNGSALCWGYNSFGQLGNGSTGGRSYVPVFVSGGYNFSQVSVGDYHSCGILTNGSAMCWGKNDYGKLGNGESTDSDVPVFVAGDYKFYQIFVGDVTTCAILTNESAVCWGANGNGELGNGSAGGYSTVPVFVAGNYRFAQIGSGNDQTCGILTNGSALCWGNNGYGQLGDGTTTSSSTPVFVSGNYSWSQIIAGGGHSCGILINGSALCWGANFNGDLGDGTTTNRYTPTFVSGDYSFINNSYYWNKDTLVSILPSSYYSSGDTITFECSVLNDEDESNVESASKTI